MDYLHDFVGLHDMTASENIDWLRGWRISGTHGGRAVFFKRSRGPSGRHFTYGGRAVFRMVRGSY